MRRWLFLFSIIPFLIFQGCSQKSLTKFKTSFQNIFKSKKEKKVTTTRKMRKNPYLRNLKRYFPETIHLGKALPKESVIDLDTPLIPKECRAVGWVSVFFPKGLNVRTVIFKEIYEMKRKELEKIKKEAALNGVKYVNSYFDPSHSEFVKVYDPYLKKRLQAQITPFKHVLIYNGKLYRESVRAYRCESTIQKSKKGSR